MLDWVGEALQGAVSWLGESLVKILDWLLSGTVSVLTKAIDAADGIFDVLNSLWNFFVSIKDLLLNLFALLFPFVPPEVMSVVSLGLFAVLLAGIVKKVRG